MEAPMQNFILNIRNKPLVLLSFILLSLTSPNQAALGQDGAVYEDLILTEITIAFRGPRDGEIFLRVDPDTKTVTAGAVDDSDAHKWIIIPTKDGRYRVTNVTLGNDYSLAATRRNGKVRMAATDNADPWQSWTYREAGDGLEILNGGTNDKQSLLFDPQNHVIPILNKVGPCCNGYQTWRLSNPAWEPQELPDWSVPITDPPMFFFADDVDVQARKGMIEAMTVATEVWGNYGPLEYWVQGVDEAAGRALVQRFCERRVELRNTRLQPCLNRELRGEHSLLSYQALGAEAVATKQPSGSAGRNGSAEWGLHRFASSMPWGMMENSPFGTAGDGDQKTIFHEYFHAVQHAQIHPGLPRDDRDRLLGPVWFIEGGAEYMATTGHAQAQAAGLLPIWGNGEWDRSYKAYRKSMGRKFRDAVRDHGQHDCVAEMVKLTYESPCRRFFYDGGSWAVAVLASRHGEMVLLDEFYPNLKIMSWEEAFVATFEQSSEEFYEDFRELLEGSVRDALKILPKI